MIPTFERRFQPRASGQEHASIVDRVLHERLCDVRCERTGSGQRDRVSEEHSAVVELHTTAQAAVQN